MWFDEKTKKPKTNLFIKFVFGFFVFLFFLIPNFANANVLINEVMYDPDGLDTGREWIEIFNNRSESVDISGWKLFEANTNHKINSLKEGGSLIIPANSFAIIVDNSEKFFADHNSFSGLVFDSTFSLSNTGEKFLLNDADLNKVDEFSYTSDQGANGDGNSLQLVNGKWIAGSPTQGRTNQNESALSPDTNSNETKNSNSSQSQTSSQTQSSNNAFDTLKIFADAGEDKQVIVGADTLFKGRALGLKKEPLKNARYLWNFGDGSTKEGENVLHSYQYPGDYVVFLNVSSGEIGEFVEEDRILVKAQPADIVISKVDSENNFIELSNRSNFELNLSWWRIRSGNQFFTLPKNTIILANKKIIFSSKITSLNFGDLSQVYLLYPNGEIAYQYEDLLSLHQSQTVQNNTNPKSQIIISKQIQNTNDQNLKQAISKNTQTLEEKNIEDFVSENKNQEQLASVGGVSVGWNKLFNKWTFGLFGIILVSVVGILFVEKKDDMKLIETPAEDNLNPDDFKIID